MCDRDATIHGLLKSGFHEVTIRTRKYRAFAANGRWMLVGKSGALRSVREGGPISDSISLTGSRFHKHLIDLGREAGKPNQIQMMQLSVAMAEKQ